MNKKAQLMAAALLVAMPWANAVAEDPSLQELEALFAKGDMQASYQASEALLERYAGESQFDYIYGVSAIDSGHVNEGVFALERVLLLKPDYHAARLELARGYFVLDEFGRSREEFTRVLESNPPASVVEKVNRFLAVMERRKQAGNTNARGWVRLGVGYDDNVNLSPGISQVPLYGQTIDLTNQGLTPVNARSLDAVVSEFEAGGSVGLMLGKRTRLNIGSQIFSAFNDEASNLNTTTIFHQAGLSHQLGKHQLGYGLFHASELRRERLFRNRAGLQFNWSMNINANSGIQSYFQYAQTDHKHVALTRPDLTNRVIVQSQENAVQLNARDTDFYNLGVSYGYRFNGRLQPTLRLQVYVGKEDVRNAAGNNVSLYERDLLGASLSASINLSPRQRLSLSYQYQNTEYGAAFAQALSGTTQAQVRDEDLGVSSIKYDWAFASHWLWSSHLQHYVNEANFSQFEYDKTRFVSSVTYRF